MLAAAVHLAVGWTGPSGRSHPAGADGRAAGGVGRAGSGVGRAGGEAGGRAGAAGAAGGAGGAGTEACLYAGPGIQAFEASEQSLGPFRCAMVFADTAEAWPAYVRPWFLGGGDPTRDWAAWTRADPARRLIITLSLVPTDVPADWRDLGAAGRYDGWYQTLGRNLVSAGLGDSVIRLDPEANFKPGTESAGSNAAEIASWRILWARAANILKATPDSGFRLDWTVNAGYRDLPLAEVYPGSSAVDIIGIDAYDQLAVRSAPPAGPGRWNAVISEPDGLDAVARFAEQHHKRFSIPEWGLLDSTAGAGDDPDYVSGMLSVFQRDQVLYQSYFDNGGRPGVVPIEQAPRSLALYRPYIGR
jgi:hypothetical protein